MLGQPAATAAGEAIPVQTGRDYRVGLALTRAEAMSPSWIVGSIMAAYPGAEVAKIESYRADSAVVLVRWKGPSSKLVVGDTVAPIIEGLQVPLAALPVGTIQSAQEVQIVPGGVEQAISSVGEERAITLRLVLSGAILVTVWYLSSRVKVPTR